MLKVLGLGKLVLEGHDVWSRRTQTIVHCITNSTCIDGRNDTSESSVLVGLKCVMSMWKCQGHYHYDFVYCLFYVATFIMFKPTTIRDFMPIYVVSLKVVSHHCFILKFYS